jgi:GH15 family glucan-1,4-alpha-glucosidase
MRRVEERCLWTAIGRTIDCMALRIEDYALIGDCHTAALVGRDGSVDWLCLPRFDSGACFAALLGDATHGRWLLAPTAPVRRSSRHYRSDTLVLETELETDHGAVTLVDCMPPRTRQPEVVRLVVGRRGRVPMRMELVIRFDYGAIIPWVRRMDGGIRAVAGPEALRLQTPVALRGENLTTVAEFTVAEGQHVPFVLTWHPSNHPAPPTTDAEAAVGQTEQWWREWSGRCTYTGEWHEAVVRSLITLKALTYEPTGGIVAAATTSLPEQIGGVRNWDYRYCWLRDATFTLYALMIAGYADEARAWREWLLRAVAGTPDQLQVLYGLGGERRLTELELDWLPGYEGSSPVRIGNAAHRQCQLDVFGEIIDALYFARRVGLKPDENAWHVERALLDHLESNWQAADVGIWEVRGPQRQFTHSKVMAWVAVDRAIKNVERFGLDGPAAQWRRWRDTIHTEICQRGFDAERGAFVQSYGSKDLDASLLMMPLVGFLPVSDPRMRGTVEAIERHLTTDGLVARYATSAAVDGLPPGEAAFLLCTFWLADNFALLGRQAEARRLFERLLDIRNDVGLLAEQYDPRARRLMGNFPQAFSHVALINTAHNLTPTTGPAAHHRRG